MVWLQATKFSMQEINTQVCFYSLLSFSPRLSLKYLPAKSNIFVTEAVMKVLEVSISSDIAADDKTYGPQTSILWIFYAIAICP